MGHFCPIIFGRGSEKQLELCIQKYVRNWRIVDAKKIHNGFYLERIDPNFIFAIEKIHWGSQSQKQEGWIDYAIDQN